MVMNLLVPQKVDNDLNTSAAISFNRRTVLHGVGYLMWISAPDI
jgi:hypothetical protein